MELQAILARVEALRAEVHKAVVGQDRALDLLLTALLSDGHVLLEGVPGTAKTLLARAFAEGLGVGFNRVQFTPDLMPGDVLGTNLFDFRTNAFHLARGPVFTDILVADEINRTPPKTQAALLQAMQERAVTIDGVTHPLPGAFMVVATQNPLEQEGTYPLPEAQLDRFLFKITVGYPERDEERAMVRVHGHRTASPPIESFGIQKVAGLEELRDMRRTVQAIRLEDPVVDYVVDLVRATRGRPSLLCGASPRAASMLATAARARAALSGRAFVIPDDVKELALPVLRHRVVLAPGAEIEGMTADLAVRRVVEEVGAPQVIFPTRRAILLAAAGFPLALCAALFRPGLWGLWLSFAAISAVAFAVDAVLGLPAGRLATEVEVPDLLAVGAEAPVQVRLRAPRGAGRVEVLLDLAPEFDPAPPRALALPGGGLAELAIPLRARRRGLHPVEAVWCRWTGPLGLCGRQLRRLVGKRVAVVPDLRPVRAAAFRYFGSRELEAGVQVERFPGDGSEFDALVEHVPGMDPRSISWKASARHRELLCQQYRAERNHQVVLALDTGHLMAEPLEGLPRLDHAVSSALLLGYVGLKLGDRVGLYGFDRAARAWAEPQGGLGAFPRLQALSAGLAYSTEETNFTLGLTELSVRLRRRSLVVVFTDFTDTVTAELMLENLQRLARRQLVVFVTLRDPALDRLAQEPPRRLSGLYRAVTASDFVRERERVLSRLRRMGVACVEAAPGQVSARLVSRYLDIKRRELIA